MTKTFPSIGTSSPGATGTAGIIVLSALGMCLAAAHWVKPS